MSRKSDLEQHIRESYNLIREYEAIIQTSPEPKEKARARREMGEQWALIESYLAEYRPLAGGALPEEIAGIAARFSAPAESTSSLDTPEAEAARDRYLAALRERYGIVIAHSLSLLAEDERVGSIPQLPLLGEGGVYVPLTFDAPTARRGGLEGGEGPEPSDKGEAHLRELAEREMAPLGLADALALPGHLAIIGDAGSGKTTSLHVLATALATENAAALLSESLIRALPEPRPLPVLLPLRLFEYACGHDERYTRCVADLLRFVDDWFSEWCPDTGLPGEFLAAHIRAGRAWFLLDALDEVADPGHRQTVRNVIQDLAHGFPGTRLIVTARVAGYRGARLDERFSAVHVRDLDEAQRGRMIQAIYAGLGLANAGRRADELAAATPGATNGRKITATARRPAWGPPRRWDCSPRARPKAGSMTWLAMSMNGATIGTPRATMPIPRTLAIRPGRIRGKCVFYEEDVGGLKARRFAAAAFASGSFPGAGSTSGDFVAPGLSPHRFLVPCPLFLVL